MSDSHHLLGLDVATPPCLVGGLQVLQSFVGPAERLSIEGLELPEKPEQTKTAWSLSLAFKENAPRVGIIAQMFAATESEVISVDAVAIICFDDESRLDLDTASGKNRAFREGIAQALHPLWDLGTQTMRAASAGSFTQHDIPRGTVEPVIAWVDEE